MTTIEVLRTLVGTEAQEPGTLRGLTDAELQQLRITLAAADRYVKIPNPEHPASAPLFAGHASKAAPELPDGLYEGKDFSGRPVRLAMGPSRLSPLGRTAATLPASNVDSRGLAQIVEARQDYDRTQHPSPHWNRSPTWCEPQVTTARTPGSSSPTARRGCGRRSPRSG
jgi:hypothetical protein